MPSSLTPPSRATWRRRAGAALVLSAALLATSCTSSSPNPDPGPDADTPARAAAELAAGLAKKNISTVEFVGATGDQVNDLFQPAVTGMGPISPTVNVVSVDTQGSGATVNLNYRWTFPGVEQSWTYTTQAQLNNEAGRWKTTWQPSVLAPELDGSNRLTQERLDPDRGELLGEDGGTIVSDRPVVRIGIDKAQIAADQLDASATKLAKLVKIDAKNYTAKVAGAGPEAFVEAIVYRATDKDKPANKEVFAVPGALPIQAEQMLAPNRDFARALIGTVGEATKEIVDDSNGTVVAGDQVGLSGLQKRYDKQLRGTPGVQVQLVAAKTSASASPSPSATPTTSSTAKPVSLFEVKPTAGQPLTTTLNIDLQKLAETTLAKTDPASAIVAIRPSTGAILTAANGPGADGQSIATTGQFPPGSTFKVVSALALLRAGLSPASSVTCPETVTVDGKKFKNYSDYPSGSRGSINLRTAVAQSCNTAFIGQRGKIKDGDLAAAAASLGMGTDYDVGFPAFFGSMGADDSETGRAAALIGQGSVQASPLAMAAVAASVSAGETIIPHLLDGQEATSSAKPLTGTEAKQLREMMRAVVTQGSGRVLSSAEPPAIIAKTGTAEYGAKAPYKTHTWMIAAQGDLAVAVFVRDGESGSQTAGPLLRRFLSDAQ
ncbi:MAG TPA: penicillin-binding transpeptidase domain-containing protein [Propionibacteriaceae bacterium]